MADSQSLALGFSQYLYYSSRLAFILLGSTAAYSIRPHTFFARIVISLALAASGQGFGGEPKRLRTGHMQLGCIGLTANNPIRSPFGLFLGLICRADALWRGLYDKGCASYSTAASRFTIPPVCTLLCTRFCATTYHILTESQLPFFTSFFSPLSSLACPLYQIYRRLS
jgi:hypothetical protein